MEEKINAILRRMDVMNILKGTAPNHYLHNKYVEMGLGTFNVNNGGWKWTKDKHSSKEENVWDKFKIEELFSMYEECRDSWLIPHQY